MLRPHSKFVPFGRLIPSETELGVGVYFQPTASLSNKATRPIDITYSDPTIAPIHTCNQTKRNLSHSPMFACIWGRH